MTIAHVSARPARASAHLPLCPPNSCGPLGSLAGNWIGAIGRTCGSRSFRPGVGLGFPPDRSTSFPLTKVAPRGPGRRAGVTRDKPILTRDNAYRTIAALGRRRVDDLCEVVGAGVPLCLTPRPREPCRPVLSPRWRSRPARRGPFHDPGIVVEVTGPSHTRPPAVLCWSLSFLAVYLIASSVLFVSARPCLIVCLLRLSTFVPTPRQCPLDAKPQVKKWVAHPTDGS